MATHNIEVTQGGTFKMKITLKTAGGFVPIQDYTFSGVVKNSIYDTDGFPMTFQKIDEANGALLGIIEDEVTKDMDFTKGVYGIYYTIDGHETFPLISGDVDVTLGVF